MLSYNPLSPRTSLEDEAACGHLSARPTSEPKPRALQPTHAVLVPGGACAWVGILTSGCSPPQTPAALQASRPSLATQIPPQKHTGAAT